MSRTAVSSAETDVWLISHLTSLCWQAGENLNQPDHVYYTWCIWRQTGGGNMWKWRSHHISPESPWSWKFSSSCEYVCSQLKNILFNGKHNIHTIVENTRTRLSTTWLAYYSLVPSTDGGNSDAIPLRVRTLSGRGFISTSHLYPRVWIYV